MTDLVGKNRGLGKIKTGGRKKGSLNKVNRDLKEAIRAFIENNIEEVEQIWNDMPNKSPAKLQFFFNMIRFILPFAVSEEEKETNNVIRDTIKKLNESKSKEAS